MSFSNQKGHSTRSEALYSILLRLYPRHFREKFGAAMLQLFRDQERDVRGGNTRSGLITLWLRTILDLARSLPEQHYSNLKGRMNAQSILNASYRNLSFARIFLAAAACFIAACVAATLFILPKSYLSIARIEVKPRQVENGAEGAHTYDPYFIQTAFEKVKSRRVLGPVIEELGLRREFAEERGLESPLSASEAYEALASMISIRQSRNTQLLEIRVFSVDSQAAAEIANKIADRFKTVESAALQSRIIDPAAPGARPVRPNVPLNIAASVALSIPAGLLIALALRILLKLMRREAPGAEAHS